MMARLCEGESSKTIALQLGAGTSTVSDWKKTVNSWKNRAWYKPQKVVSNSAKL